MKDSAKRKEELLARKLERQKERDKKELAKMLRKKAKPKPRGYLGYMLFIITVVYVADEISTQIGTQMQDVMADVIFAPIFGKEAAVSSMSILNLVAIFVGIFSMFYKPLSDKYGRKKFLVINTIGMGVGMIIISLCTTIPVYLLGSCILTFFIPHDMQAVYIYEVAPEEKRGRFYSIAKAFATFGMLAIPVLRSAFSTYEYVDGVKVMTDINYFMVYFIPGALAIVAALLALFFVRESDAYIDGKIRLLTMTEEEKAAEEKDKTRDTHSRGGVLSAAKYLFSHNQLKWMMLAQGVMMCGILVTMYYTIVINSGYESFRLTQGATVTVAEQYGKAMTTKALTLFAVGSGLVQLGQGFLSDAIGRKKAAIIMGTLCIVTYLFVYFGPKSNWTPYLIGFLAGASVGAYWAASDITNLMSSESVPTNLRNSVGAVQPFLASVIFAIFYVAYMVLMGIFGDAAIGKLVLCFAAPGLAIGLAILMFKVKETKGVDLATIKGDEFED